MDGGVCVIDAGGTHGDANRLAEQLSDRGCGASSVESVTEALDRVRRGEVRCVICASSEPLARVRAHDPDLPFVLYTPEPNLDAAFEAGVTDVVPTDRGVEELAPRVRRALDRYDEVHWLRDRETSYRTIVEQTHDAVLVGTLDSFRMVNDAACEQAGYTRAELLEMDPFDLIHPDERERVQRQAIARSKGADIETHIETRFLRRDGAVRTVELTVTPTVFDGEYAVIIVARDLTDRRANERALREQNKRLEEFASIVSHDLRAPLMVADGNIELARMDHESEYLDAATDALDRMDDLIDDLLTLARSGQLANEPERLRLEEVAHSAWSNVRTGESDLVVETDCELDADPGRLQSMLENLFRNAVEHGSTGSRSQARGNSIEHGTSPGAAPLTVRVGTLDGGFFVADDGPGIPAEKREQVLEPGYTTSDDGTGFGLAIVEQVAEAHGWSLHVAESEDGGARFEIRDVQFAPIPVEGE